MADLVDTTVSIINRLFDLCWFSICFFFIYFRFLFNRLVLFCRKFLSLCFRLSFDNYIFRDRLGFNFLYWGILLFFLCFAKLKFRVINEVDTHRSGQLVDSIAT
jgi:hypothetical protein